MAGLVLSVETNGDSYSAELLAFGAPEKGLHGISTFPGTPTIRATTIIPIPGPLMLKKNGSNW